jgi:ATP-binding cassette subfamily B protein
VRLFPLQKTRIAGSAGPKEGTMNTRLRKFISCYRPHRKIFFIDMACAAVSGAVAMIFPMASRQIIQTALTPNAAPELNALLLSGLVLLGLIIIRTACNVVYAYQGHLMGARMEADLRAELFDHLQKQSFRFFDKRRPGHLMSVITNDLLAMTELFHHGPEDLLLSLIKFGGALFFLTRIHLGLALAVFGLLPPMAVFALHMSSKLKDAYKESRERIAGVNAQAEDTLINIRAVKSFVSEDVEREKFRQENGRFLESRRRIYKSEAYLYDVMSSFPDTLTAVIVVFGGILITGAKLNLADLTAFLLYTGGLFEPIQLLMNFIRLYREGTSGFSRFMELMETKPDITDDENAMELPSVRGEVTFRNVGFRYGEDREYVLKDVNLSARPGEPVAVVGASGIGKTTMCALIPRFYDVTEGQVLLDGVDIRRVKLSSLRKNIGVVQQETYLFSGTVLENIRYGRPGASREYKDHW